MGLLNETQQSYYNGDNFGGYQFASLNDIINQFMIIYVGEDKIIPKARRVDVAFHAQRAMQELSFDTFKSCKSQEVTIPPSLQMILPQDYVNYTKISWVDTAGIKHPIYPTSKTSNPPNPYQNDNNDYTLTAVGTFTGSGIYITLDDEYTNIVAGMVITSPNTPVGTVVRETTHAGGVTTVRILNSAGALGPYTGTETIAFSNLDGSLVAKRDAGVVLDDLTWIVNSLNVVGRKITANSVDDAAKVEVGMVLSNQRHFPIGAFVADVNGAVITMSENSLVASTTATDQLTFIPPPNDSTTWSNYKSNSPSENNQNDYDGDDDIYDLNVGQRYGLDPQHAQVNGSFYIDCNSGKIHFSSNISGKTVVLDYLSDGLGTDEEMKVHKFAEEAMYKWISHAIMAGRANVPEYQVNRFKKERFAAIRTAKLRLSNIKLEEITQILRGKSKQIKH